MGAVLAAMLGQIGLPGGGYNYALGALGHTGRRLNAVPIPTLSQGKNGVSDFIPVARVADMLLNPGERFEYNGRSMHYPDIKLVYWAGGNPFHHHQDINRLRRAFNVPQTIVVHESAWTPMAKFADIVLPATMTLERDDIGAAGTDPRLIAMRRAVRPDRRSARRFRYFCRAVASDWASSRPSRKDAAAGNGWPISTSRRGRRLPMPAGMRLTSRNSGGAANSRCRRRPMTAAFCAPSATIPSTTSCRRQAAGSRSIRRPSQASATTIARRHPAWLPSTEPPTARHPLTLIANQPATRLHSQLDFGAYSQSKKIAGREVVRLNPADAAQRGIADGDIVRLFNDRGACLAAAAVTDDVMPGVVQLSTGAWYDPAPGAAEQPLCVHGNPNVLTRDIGTSRLAQGCCGQVTVVECEKYTGTLPAIRAFDPPDQD